MSGFKPRRMGRSGLQVQPLCLGTMTFGLQVDEPGSFAILDRAYELGMRFLDTADAYPLGGGLDTIGDTEAIIGRWLAARGCRDEWVIATKCFAKTHRGLNAHGLSRAHIMRAAEASLKRLGTDHIDLYQAHGDDPEVPIEETLRAWDDLIAQGKVRYVGCSNFTAWRLMQSLGQAGHSGLPQYVSVQPRYNMLYREIETELLPLCIDQGIGTMVYNPLAGGLLSGKYDRNAGLQENTRFTLGNAAERYQARYWHDAYFDTVATVMEAARHHDVDMVGLAVRWVLDQPGITSAIIGASRPEQLDANVAAVELDIPEALQKVCDDAWFALPRRPVAEGYR